MDALRERDPALTPEEAQARAVAAMGDRTDNGLILVISNASEIVRTEVVFPASNEGDTGFYLLSADQVRRAENCFLFSYSMSGLCAHYPEDLQVRGYNAAGTLVYQSPVPESWESRYELR